MRYQVLLDDLGIGDRLSGDVLIDRADAVAELCGIDCLGKFHAGRFHERAMEGTAHIEREHSLSAGFFQFQGSLGDALHCAGDHDLTRRVIVGGYDHLVAHGCAGRFHLGIFHADDGGHGTRLGFAGLLHGVGAFGHQAEAVFKRQHLVGHQGRELAQRVAGDHIRLEVLQDGSQDDRVEEDGGLGDLGLAKILISAVEHHLGDLKIQNSVGFMEHVSRLRRMVEEILAHADKLCPLSGENVCS